VSRINLIADLIEHQADLLIDPNFDSRREAVLQAIEHIDWRVSNHAGHNARERLGWILLEFQHKQPSFFANSCFSSIQKIWKENQHLRLNLSNQLLINAEDDGTMSLFYADSDIEHFRKNQPCWFPSFNQIKAAANLFCDSNNQDIIAGNARYLADIIPTLSFVSITDSKEDEIHSIEKRNLSLPYFEWKYARNEEEDPASWTPQILAYLQTQEPAILETLIYFGVVVDPRVPELAVLAEKMQLQANAQQKDLIIKEVRIPYYEDLSLKTYDTVFLTADYRYQRFGRPHDPDYFQHDERLPPHDYYPELDGWQQYREAESQRLAARDREEQDLLAAIDWQELRQDWHGFIERYKKQLTPELSVCDGGWLFAQRFMQEATQLATENPKQFRPLLQWFFMKGLASHISNQKSHWNGDYSFFYNILRDEESLWLKNSHPEVLNKHKILNGLASMRPQHPYSQFIIKDPLDLFSWHNKLLLLEDSAFMHHHPQQGKDYGKVTIVPEYKDLFLNPTQNFSELLAYFPWRTTKDPFDEKEKNDGDIMRYDDISRLYLAEKANHAINEGWQPRDMGEYTLLHDMVYSIYDLVSILHSDWMVRPEEGEEYKRATSPYPLDSLEYEFEERSPLWMQNIVQKIDGLELAHAYILALELDLRRFYPAPLRQAETRLETLLTDESLSSEDKLPIAETILFNRRFTQKGTLFFHPPYDGVINAIPLRKG
ncbi:MAG: hypothetical protein ACOYK8_10830, partial [Alphaproteobacteria bacterium]